MQTRKRGHLAEVDRHPAEQEKNPGTLHNVGWFDHESQDFGLNCRPTAIIPLASNCLL